MFDGSRDWVSRPVINCNILCRVWCPFVMSSACHWHVWTLILLTPLAVCY